MAALLNPYCTLEDLQEELKNDEAAQVDWFVECINRASRMVDAHCRTDFLYHNYSATPLLLPHTWVVGGAIFLPFPIIALTSITDNDSGVVLDAEQYLVTEGIDAQGNISSFGKIQYSSDIPLHPTKKTIELLGEFGTTAADEDEVPENLPAEVRIATIRTAAALSGYNQKQVLTLDGQRSEILDNRIPKEVAALLNRWRVIEL